MRKSLLSVAALSLALAAGAVAPAFAAGLTQVARDQFEQQIEKADKPSIVLAVPKTCAACAAVEEALAANAGKFTNFQVVKVNGDDVGMRGKTPGLLVFVPGRGTIAETSNFDLDAAGTAAFLQAKSDYFTKRVAAAAAAKQAKDALTAAEAPYKKRVDDVVAKAQQDFKADIDALNALEDKMYASTDQAGWAAAEKAYNEAAAALAQKTKPVEDQVKAIQEEAKTALASQIAASKDAQAALRQLDKDGQAFK